MQKLSREAVAGDDRQSWLERWESEAGVPSYIMKVFQQHVEESAAAAHWCQQALITYNSADWVLKDTDGNEEKFDGLDVDEVAAAVRDHAVVVALRAQAFCLERRSPSARATSGLFSIVSRVFSVTAIANSSGLRLSWSLSVAQLQNRGGELSEIGGRLVSR